MKKMRRGSRTSVAKITQYFFHGICNHQDIRGQFRNEFAGTEIKADRSVFIYFTYYEDRVDKKDLNRVHI